MMGNCVEIIVLPLYSTSLAEGKYVQPNAGINIWKAGGRRRTENEIEIQIPEKFMYFMPFFFPSDGETFELRLPNYVTLSAKCNKDGSVLVSSPIAELGKWLLRQVLKIPAGTVVDYDMLEKRGIDAVYIEKWIEGNSIFYKIFPAPVGEYELFAKNGIKERKEIKTAKELFIERMTSLSPEEAKAEGGLTEGASITHKAFGKGLVKSVNKDMVELDFDGTIKTFKYSWLIENKMITIDSDSLESPAVS